MADQIEVPKDISPKDFFEKFVPEQFEKNKDQLPDEMKEHVREFLREVAPGKHFGLGSGDAIPMHTPPEVLRAVGDVIAEEGAYPLSL